MAKSKLLICKEYNVQPSEIDRLVFFEYEYMIEDIKENQKERETQQEQEEKQRQQMTRQMKNPTSMYKDAFKTPEMPKFSTPSFSMPSFNMPKI